MNVDPTGPVRGTQSTRRSERSGARGGEFSRHLEFNEGGSAVSSTRTAAPVDALLSMQQVEDDGDPDSRGKRRAHTMLEMLDDIRRDLLSGVVDRARLSRLSTLVSEGRDDIVDPRLRVVLDEVELRAAVEIAKLEMESEAA